MLQMKVRDYFMQGRRGWVRLHEKGGKEHEAPCHHNLEQYLDECIAAAGIMGSGRAFIPDGGRPDRHAHRQGHVAAGRLPHDPAADGGTCIKTRIGNHTFRAKDITAYLKNKGTLEAAQRIANHESPRVTR